MCRTARRLVFTVSGETRSNAVKTSTGSVTFNASQTLACLPSSPAEVAFGSASHTGLRCCSRKRAKSRTMYQEAT